MSFRAEPAGRHGGVGRTALMLVNLGTPDEPTPAATRRYLAEFLSDRRVVEIPRIAWWPILHGFVLRTRPARSAAKYASIWMPEGSPLAVWTQRQATALAARLGELGHNVDVRVAMRYGEPSIDSVLDTLHADAAARVLVLPLYPQYAAATTASTFDAVGRWCSERRRLPELRFVGEFHADAAYVAALAERLQTHWRDNGRAERLVLSFHGLPERSVKLGDPYHGQCLKTASLLGERLGMDPGQLLVTFQSRFGKARWLEPYTEPTLRRLAAEGTKSVDVFCPGFVADCLETLEEIDHEVRAAFIESGGERFAYVSCLNDRSTWVHALASIAERHLQGWPTRAVDATESEPADDHALALGATD